eukprot:Skav206435  [mRNA]  locus=scaffold295:79495:80286:+ [translate_table: standard]
MADGSSKRHKSSHESTPSGRILTCKTECKTESPATASAAVPSSQDDLTVEDLETWGVLREFDPNEVVRILEDQGKAGWKPDPMKPSTANLSDAFLRYTLGRGTHPYTWKIKTVNNSYEATLVTCLSTNLYVGHGPTEAHAKRAAADRFLRDPEVQEVFSSVPPTQNHIRKRCDVHGQEKDALRAFGVSAGLISQVCQKRMREVNELLHEKGYRTDLWDGHA